MINAHKGDRLGQKRVGDCLPSQHGCLVMDIADLGRELNPLLESVRDVGTRNLSRDGVQAPRRGLIVAACHARSEI